MIYFGNSPQNRIYIFRINHILKKLTLKILNVCFYFMDYRFTFKLEKRKKWGHRTNDLSGGPNVTPPPQITRIIQYKALRSVFFCHLYITYYLFEVTQHYNAKKRRKVKQGIIGAYLIIDHGPLVPKSGTLTTSLRGKVVRGSK